MQEKKQNESGSMMMEIIGRFGDFGHHDADCLSTSAQTVARNFQC